VHSREADTPVVSAPYSSATDNKTELHSLSLRDGTKSRDSRHSVELEEGEILSETPPRNVDLSETATTRYPSRNSPVEIDQPREVYGGASSARMSKQSSGSTGSENREFARQSLRRSGLLDDVEVQTRLSLDGNPPSPSISPSKRQQRQERSETHQRARYPAVRHSLSVLDLSNTGGAAEHSENSHGQPVSERATRLASTGKKSSLANAQRPVTPVMSRDAEEQDLTPSRRTSHVSTRNDRYEGYAPRSAGVERSQIENKANGTQERQTGHQSVLPRRSQTALSRYSDRVSDSADLPSPMRARDFPRTTNDGSSSTPDVRYGQRRLRHSHSPDRRSIASASRQAITNSHLRRDRASAGSNFYSSSSIQRPSMDNSPQHSVQGSQTSPRSPANERLARLSSLESSNDLREVLTRVRARTLSAQDAGNVVVARARSEAGRERYDGKSDSASGYQR
jgi:hypothetical protein